MRTLAIFVLALAWLSGSCSDKSEFAGSTGTAKPGKGGGNATGTPGGPGDQKSDADNPDGGPNTGGDNPSGGSNPPGSVPGDESGRSGSSGNSCVGDGQVEFKYPKQIKGCIKKGKLYNFQSEVCTNMNTADFKCTFDNVIGWLKKRGLSTSFFKEGKKKGGLMVGCGMSENGKTLVPQYWFPPDKNKIQCTYEAGVTGIRTGCYSVDPNVPIVDTSNKPKLREHVLNCMMDRY